MKIWQRLIAVLPLLLGIAGFVVAVRNETNDESAVQVEDVDAVIGNSRFCPGIPGGDLADGGWLTIGNTADVSAEARITWLTEDGQENAVATVDARSSTVVRVEDESTIVAAVVEMNVPGSIVEQHSESEAGTIRTLCTDRTATEWFFADGFTASDSNAQIVLTNPYADAAIVDVSYSTIAGRQRPNAYQGYVIPAETVRILDLAEVGARNEQLVSVQIAASTGRVIAGRVQRYRGSGRQGLGVSLGVTRAAGDWWFGFGDTTDNTAEQLVVFNPGDKPASVEITVVGYKPKTAVVQPFSIEVGAGTSAVIDMNGVTGLPRSTHAISVVASGDAQVVVERVINVINASGQIATTVSSPIAQNALAKVWEVARSRPGERIAVINVTGTKTTFTVSSFGPAGEAPLEGMDEITLAPGASALLTIPDPAPGGPVRITAGVNVVVEYLASRGEGRIGYSAALAQPVTQ